MRCEPRNRLILSLLGNAFLPGILEDGRGNIYKL